MHGQGKFKGLATGDGFRSLPYTLHSIVGLLETPFQIQLEAPGNPRGPSQNIGNATQTR
jgi:hypothetical protein